MSHIRVNYVGLPNDDFLHCCKLENSNGKPVYGTGVCQRVVDFEDYGDLGCNALRTTYPAKSSSTRPAPRTRYPARRSCRRECTINGRNCVRNCLETAGQSAVDSTCPKRTHRWRLVNGFSKCIPR